jgi:hypothetical protein
MAGVEESYKVHSTPETTATDIEKHHLMSQPARSHEVKLKPTDFIPHAADKIPVLPRGNRKPNLLLIIKC